ncbi:MAG: hypothetical protein KDD62_01100 [Bdellovibrionales bacterium]|nr:hypothetical protein [Bdellovibrionales bacterium]
MFLDNATGTETTFWICALVGTSFFGLRVLLNIIGFGGHDFDGAHHGVDAGSALDADASFSLISLNSIASYLAMFGWAGLACHVQFQFGVFISIVIAAGVGFFTMFVTAYLFHVIHKLTNTGESFEVEQSIGQVATVYQRIPADGSGVVQVAIHGLMRELTAVSERQEAIESFTKVTVVRVIDSSTVVVNPV